MKQVNLEKEFEAKIHRALNCVKSLRREQGELDAIEHELEKGLRTGFIDGGYIYEKTHVVKSTMDSIRYVAK